MSSESVSRAVLVLLGIVAFQNYRSGTLGDWLRSKFLNLGPGESTKGTTASGPKIPAIAPSTGPQALGSAGGAAATGAGLLAPVSGPVTSGFGVDRGDHKHAGLDYGVPTGTPVGAAKAGTVTLAGTSGGYGLRVDVDHGGGLSTRYAHLSRIDVRVGQAVAAGSTLGLSGSTGESTGTHVHFEVRQGGIAKDPVGYLAAGRAGAVIA